MFKSKKRMLLVLGALLTISGATAAGVFLRGDLFGDSSQQQAKNESGAPAGNPEGDANAPSTQNLRPKQPAPNQYLPSGAQPPMTGSAPRGGSFGSYTGQSSVSPASYPPPGEPTVVRGNDDGSFRSTSPAPASSPSTASTPISPAPTPPARMTFSDQPEGASQTRPTNGGSSFPATSSQQFLPPASDTAAPASAPDAGPPSGLSPATGLQPPANFTAESTQVSPAGPPPSQSFDAGSGSTNVPSSHAPSSSYAPVDDRYSNTGRSAAAFGGANSPSPPPARFDEGAGNTSRLEPPSAYSGTRGLAAANTGAGEYRADAGGAAGEPGPKQLEGIQSPSLTIEKVAPGEVQVGKQANFLIKVRNVGQVDAEEVVVFDQTPRGTRYVGSTPEAARAGDGSLMWPLGTLKSGEESTITLQLVPLQEGQIGSVARVAFAAKASASTICTKPLLTVEHTGPSSVLIGESVNLTIVISNPGTGIATGVTLEEDVPDGLTHPAGNELEYEIGELRPGESRKLELSLTAAKPGLISNLLLVRGDGNLVTEDRLELEVVAPQLDIALTGPSKRYLERQATYSVRVANPGTAAAKNIELVTYLPKGLKFLSTDNHGQYDAQNHAVYWSLEELPPRMTGDVTVTAIPIETGQQKLRVEGRGDLGLTAAYDQEVLVEGLAELFFQVVDAADPIEVNSETEYEIRVINQGSKTDTNVRVIAQLPVDLEPIGGDGPTRVRVDGQNVIFEPLARLAPKGSAVYKVRVRGVRPGDHRVRVQVVSDEVRTPVNKEESTRVYADQ